MSDPTRCVVDASLAIKLFIEQELSSQVKNFSLAAESAMVQDVRYVTNESGKRVSVLMDLATYHQLTATHNDPELLTGLSNDELVALAESALSLDAQSQLHDLLSRNAEGELSGDDLSTLDQLLARVDDLNLLKTRARYTLEHLSQLAS